MTHSPVLARPRRRPVAALPLHVAWFSGEAHVPEQVGKKVAVELSLPAHEPAAYADADVRFFARSGGS